MQHKPLYKTVRLVDIDGTTLFQGPTQPGLDYAPGYSMVPLPNSQEIINQWYEQGDIVIFWTARSKCYEEITRAQLDSLGYKYHDILMDKPYTKDLHIYDNNLITVYKVEKNIGLAQIVSSSDSK